MTEKRCENNFQVKDKFWNIAHLVLNITIFIIIVVYSIISISKIFFKFFFRVSESMIWRTFATNRKTANWSRDLSPIKNSKHSKNFSRFLNFSFISLYVFSYEGFFINSNFGRTRFRTWTLDGSFRQRFAKVPRSFEERSRSFSTWFIWIYSFTLRCSILKQRNCQTFVRIWCQGWFTNQRREINGLT